MESSQVSPTVNLPVRSLQTFLRKISQVHREIPPVIPDGRYGSQTQEAVSSFQRKFGLPVTGSTDHDTWQRVAEVYREAVEKTAQPRPARIFPRASITISPGESSENLYAIQGMMVPLTHRYANLGQLTVTGTHDAASTDCVRKLQHCFGQQESGVIDKAFWELLAALYEAQVPPPRLRPAGTEPDPGEEPSLPKPSR